MNMLTLTCLAMASVVLTSCCTTPETAKQSDDNNMRLASEWLHEIRSIKTGDSREDLLRLFQPVGNWSRTTGMFSYRKCRFVCVDVTFDVDDERAHAQPSDKIGAISKPYLDYPPID